MPTEAQPHMHQTEWEPGENPHRQWVAENIQPIFQREPSLRVPPFEYDFNVRHDQWGEPTEPSEFMEQMRQDLEANPEMPIVLYTHIPTCPYNCKFCTFLVKVSKSEQKSDSYAHLLVKELENLLEAYPWLKGRKISTLYVGGGTPTTMSPEATQMLVEAYSAHFDVLEAQITMEGSPDTIVQKPERLDAARKAGVNRISMGIQSFDPDVLDAAGRYHSPEEAEKAIREIKKRGFDEVSVDLIRGLPHQTLEGLADDLEKLAELDVDSIFVYRYRGARSDVTDERKSAWEAKPNESAHPPIEETLAMHRLTDQVLTKHGYKRVSGCQWKKNDERAYGTDRWGGDSRKIPMIGLGWGSYSFNHGGEGYNAHSLAEWERRVNDGEVTLEKANGFNPHERELVHIQFDLKDSKINKQIFEEVFEKPIEESDVWPRVERLIELGLLREEGDLLVSTETGVALEEEMIQFLKKESSQNEIIRSRLMTLLKFTVENGNVEGNHFSLELDTESLDKLRKKFEEFEKEGDLIRISGEHEGRKGVYQLKYMGSNPPQVKAQFYPGPK